MPNYLNSTIQNISWFNKLHEDGELDMSPPYQRKPVWVDKQKSYLIDTILHGYPIPEIYMQQVMEADGTSKHIVVDGQQRIRSVLDFIQGKFTLDPKDSPDLADIGFEDLTTRQKKDFFGYNFVIRTLPDLPETELREIFRRINTNVLALNAQELRQAIYWGHFIFTMNELSNYPVWIKFGLFTPNDIRRMLDVEFISELAVAVLHGYQNKKTSLDTYYRLYEQNFEEASVILQLFNVVLGEITRILPDISSTRWSKKSDFYSLFLVFAYHVDALPLPSEKRVAASKKLTDFANKVDELSRVKSSEKTNAAKYSASLRNYSSHVIRSASDLGSRKARGEALEKLLATTW
jgi:hypothetical protein